MHVFYVVYRSAHESFGGISAGGEGLRVVQIL